MYSSLKQYWSPDRADNFVTATAQGERDALDAKYSLVRIEGYVFPNSQPGIVPLKLYWNDARGDNFTTATPEGERAALEAGYHFIREEGYVYPNKQPNTVPLKLYWNDARGDNFCTATPQGEQDALAAGYNFIRVEGYVAPNTNGRTVIETTTPEDEVGFAKKMRTTAILYKNGLLTVKTFSETRAAFSALRGCVIIICLDDSGVAHYVSDTVRCTVRCALLDPTCTSSGTNAWTQQLPEAVGRLSTELNVIHFEGEDPVGFTQRIINGIKDTGRIAEELKPLVEQLGPVIRDL